MAIFAVYFTQLEIRKMARIRTQTGIFQLIFHILVIILFIIDNFSSSVFTTSNERNISFGDPIEDFFLMFSSAIIIFSYFIQLLQMRIFERFAVLINLIFQVMIESINFMLIFFIIVTAFANAIFILCVLEHPDTQKDVVVGPNIFTAFLFSFRMSMGEAYQPQLDGSSIPYVYGVFSTI